MKEIKLQKSKLIAFMLVAIMAFCGAASYKTMAANLIDTEKTCTITARVSGDASDLLSQHYTGDITVNLYKIADISSTGAYTIASGYENAGIDLSYLTSGKASVEDIKTGIVDKAIAAVSGKEADATITLNRTAGQTASSASANVGVGLYLYAPQACQSDRYSYEFTSYIVSAPTSAYLSTGTGTDEWIYGDEAGVSIDFTLKAEETARVGSLEIDKTLDTFNTSLGTASFVYDVEAVLDERTVFSNVYQLDFTEAGSNSITIDGIPAGATVTVTEVYTGASYTLTSEASAATVIVADDTVNVAFSNTYDNRVNVGGTAVTNTFEYKAATETEAASYEWKGAN